MAVDLRGQVLWAGEYEIKEKLAQGGMATVYSAYARSLDTTVAIKVLSPRLAQDPSFLERFHAEATSIAALHHPNIIEVHHFGVENGVAYIAMRMVSGGTLKERVQELGGIMDLSSAARLTAQVASALHYAHERGLVHLDVKPGNVLLGSADWPLLSDFGITRMAGDAREDGHRIAGTPAYMSPEQWQGLDLDGRSDQYSLGLMFYELVTGRRPFSGETSAELKAKHLNDEPPPPRAINPGIPGPVEEVMLRALNKRPEDRFPTCADFASALIEAVERSRGMQLETKQAIVSAAPNLVALVVLSVVAPLLTSLPDPDAPVYRALTLNWPVALIVALIQAALLLGVRWHLIGIATRLMGSIVDALDRLTRVYVRLGTDAQGPLHVKAWRNAAVASAEGMVNVAYLFVIYQIVGGPLIQTAVRPLSASVDHTLESLAQTGVAALVLLLAAGIVLKIHRSSGPIVAVCALAICWGFISAMPVVDQTIWDGRLHLQWVAKLAVGLAVLAAFLAVRGRVQRVGREYFVPAIDRQMEGIQRGRSEEQRAARRRGLERASDGLVNVVYLVVGYPIIALPLQKVLAHADDERLMAIGITLFVLLFAALLVNRLRVAGGVVPATLGLLICVPTVMGLPVFGERLLGSASEWVARPIIGLGVLAIFLGIRRQVQAMGRAIIVPVIDQQLGSLVTSSDEAQAAGRRRVLQSSSDALVNVVYLIIGYFAVVGPMTGALAGASSLTWLSAAIYAVFVLAVLVVLYGFVRGILPILRPAAPPAAPAPGFAARELVDGTAEVC